MRRLLALPLLVALLAPATPAFSAPLLKTPTGAIEALAPYVGQTTCSPTAKPGTAALRSLIMTSYKGSGDYGIIRNCATGGRSEHKEGRAWDWKVSVTNAAQVRQVHDFLTWLMVSDAHGNSYAMARRLGIMYLIWNRKIWTASSHTWKPYTGADAHTNHVHISLSWAGALKRTSYWTGVVAGNVAAPAAPAAPKPTLPAPVTLTPLASSATVTVPATSAGLTTPFLLEAGERYVLRASGTYVFGSGGRQADAECSVQPDGSWDRHAVTDPERRSLDLELGGDGTRWRAVSGEDCDAGHTYETVVEADRTARLHLRVNDTGYADNSGALRVVVTRL